MAEGLEKASFRETGWPTGGCCVDRSLLPEGQDSVVVGATAMLFHDRAASLQRIPLLSTPLTTADLDYSLWLAPFPPPDLEHNRCVFVWWTSTDSNFRRCGGCRWFPPKCWPVAEKRG